MKKRNNSLILENYYIIGGMVLFFILIIDLIYVTSAKTIDGIDIKQFANKRTTRTIYKPAHRGTIYDRNGEVIAKNISSYNIICFLDKSRSISKKDPRYIVDKELTAEKLSGALDIPKEEILNRLNKKLYQTELGKKGRNLSESKKDEILALNLPGVEFEKKEKRYYPFGDFLSYTVGYAKEVEENYTKSIKGELGIEKYYDNDLRGEDGYTIFQKARNGFKIPGTQEFKKNSKDGKDIYLTIDHYIQLFIDQAITRHSKDYEWLSMIVADAKTGEILGMSQYPSFDPNKRDLTNYLDYNISLPFEPGSTMKTYTFLTAMKKGIYDGNATFQSGYYITTDGTRINDWWHPGWGKITFDRGYSLSANTGIINLINRGITKQDLRNSFLDFGFGEKTGINLANESSGKINFKYETEFYNAGFGQGITTTPIQHIQALTSIANDGYLLKPYIIKNIYDPNIKRNVFEGNRQVLRKVMDKEDAAKMRDLMYNVTSGPVGVRATGEYYMPEYSFIGKTGTAQVASPKGGYYSNIYIKSFAGMFPYKNPKIIIYGAMKSHSDKYTILASVMKEIVKNTSDYLNFKQDDIEMVPKIKLEYLINKDVSTVTDILKFNKIKYIVLGNGNKVTAIDPYNIEIDKNDLIIIKTNAEKFYMPNVDGLTKSQINIISKYLNIKTSYDGEGYATKQSIAIDQEIVAGMDLKIKLVPKGK